jgi:hypothetical protein
MSYFLPPQGLQQLWDHVLAAVCQPGYQDFRDPELYMEAKGTKLLFKYPDVPSDLLAVMNSFDCKLHRILDFLHMHIDRLYIVCVDSLLKNHPQKRIAFPVFDQSPSSIFAPYFPRWKR